jgi:hypothetical protein
MAGPDWQWTATLALPNGQTLARLDSTRVTYDRTFCMPRGLSGYPTKGKTIHNGISDVRYFRLPGQFDLGLPPACLDYASLGLP